MKSATDIVVVLTTVPTAELGHTIARALVEQRLAACVNLLGPMDSTYRWKGAVEQATERQLVIKSVRSLVPALRARIGELHSYEMPEFIVIDVVDGSPAYLEWIVSSVRL
jgi:periplasmic divalent cation tolerance protein